MPRFIDTQQITYLETHNTVAITTNHGVAGRLEIHAFDGVNYIPVDTIIDSGSKEIYVKGLTLRFTPSDSMAYSVVLGR